MQAAAKSRIPENLREHTFFGLNDFWMYEDEKANSECDYCKTYSGQLFDGNQLRSVFPDLEVVDVDLILPNVHRTLWNTDTCKCRLKRVAVDDVPADKSVYSGEVTPHYVKQPEEDGYYSYKKR